MHLNIMHNFKHNVNGTLIKLKALHMHDLQIHHTLLTICAILHLGGNMNTIKCNEQPGKIENQ